MTQTTLMRIQEPASTAKKNDMYYVLANTDKIDLGWVLSHLEGTRVSSLLVLPPTCGGSSPKQMQTRMNDRTVAGANNSLSVES